MRQLPFRQIHLDFHTSEHIPGVGADFDADAFATMLASAHVDSINVFARCWHGWMYYDSQRFPEDVHPQLANRNLLPEMIAACHARGIAAPIYVAVQVASHTAEQHPEWMQVTTQGRLGNKGPLEPGFKAPLCLNSPYRQMVFDHVTELFDLMPAVDGFWFDGVSAQDCVCQHCLADMATQGLDPADEQARRLFGLEVTERFQREMTALALDRNPDALVYYNCGHVGPAQRCSADTYTHFEIESLPSGGWGYMHFPAVARYVRRWCDDVVGMTGKFHTSWGDFHSFKNRAALEFECFHMLATGCKCSIGDQLHPRGKLDAETYTLIGGVYAQVEAKEPWCVGAEPLADVAVLSPEVILPEGVVMQLPDALLGAVRMLQELSMQFAVIDGSDSLDGYGLLVIPEGCTLSDELAARIDAWVAEGGSLIAIGSGPLTPARDRFALDCLGLAEPGPAPYEIEFVKPRELISSTLPATEHVAYQRGTTCALLPGTGVLAQAVRPYFDRTWQRYCSHRHAPTTGEVVHPAATQRGRAIYVAFPIMAMYRENAPRWCKQLFSACRERLMRHTMLRHTGPSTVIATATRQRQQDRDVLHLLHYVPERRGRDFDTIEDVIPLHDVSLRYQVDRTPVRVTLEPTGESLPFYVGGQMLSITVPEIVGHQMVSIAYS